MVKLMNGYSSNLISIQKIQQDVINNTCNEIESRSRILDEMSIFSLYRPIYQPQ